MKPLPYEYVLDKAKQYINSSEEYVRRFGYVIFLAGMINENTIKDIFNLLKDDDKYYVQMAEAWLICEMYVKEPKISYEYLKDLNLNYNIVGKAIQKIQDSFRITEEDKLLAKELRKKFKA